MMKVMDPEDTDYWAGELELYMVNDSGIYFSYLMPQYKRQEQRYKDGRFDRDLAVTGMMRACYAASQTYRQDTGTAGRFPGYVRQIVAASLVDGLVAELSAGNSYM